MIKCVIFDMDGTLADTMPLCNVAFCQAVKELTGRVLTEKEITDAFGVSEAGVIKKLAPENPEKGLSLYLKYYKKWHSQMCPGLFEGIPELLDWLEKHHIMAAIVTGKGKGSLEISLKVLQCENRFDHIETGNPEYADKPEGIERTRKILGVKPRETVYTGDMISDILSAKKVSVLSVFAGWASGTEIEKAYEYQPDFAAETVDQFMEWLKLQIKKS